MKIVSAAPSNTEILFKLGKGDSIVATTSLCDYPKSAAKKDSIGGWSKNTNLDKVEQYNPDKVFTSDQLQEEFRRELEEKGIETIHVSPETLEEVYQSIEKIGRSLDEKEKAREIIQSMKQELEKINLQNKRIYCEEWNNPPMISGNWIPDLIAQCKGDYIIEKGRSRKINLDELKQFDPEIIILNVCGAGLNVDKNDILTRDGWDDVTAIEENNVFVIDDSLLNRPTPRLVEGMKQIESLIENQY